MEGILTTTIVRKRRLDRSAAVYGVIASGLFVGAAIQWFRLGKIPVIEELVRQIGLTEYLTVFEITAIALLILVILRGILAILRTRLEAAGELMFQQDSIEIRKGKLSFSLSGESLNNFTLVLPKKIESQDSNGHQGGCFLKVPSPDGTFKCQFELKSSNELEQLKKILEYMRLHHQVEINIEFIEH